MDARMDACKRARAHRNTRRLAGGSLLLLACKLSAAASVQYAAIDLADTASGQDLWRVDYTVAGPLGSFEAINLLFSPTRYGALSLLGNSRPSQLDTLLSAPEPGLGTDGQLTLTALGTLDNSFLAQVSVRLVWTGGGTPGAQPYELLDGDFNVRASGQTVATPVPEVNAAWLGVLGAGLAWAAARRRLRVPA